MTEAQTVKLDLDSLSWDALEEIEDIVGHSIANELLEQKPSMRTIRALILWQLRKSDPKLTLETMPDVRSLNVEMVQKGPPVPLVPRRRRARSPRSSSGTA